MEKEYFCKKIIESTNSICGEKDQSKFSKGRYSCCISCKNNYMKSYNKKVYEIKKTDMSFSTVQRLNKCIENLGDNVKEMITSIITSETLSSMELPVKLHIEDIENKLKENKKIFDLMNQKIENLNENNKILISRNISLEMKILEMQESISFLLNK